MYREMDDIFDELGHDQPFAILGLDPTRPNPGGATELSTKYLESVSIAMAENRLFLRWHFRPSPSKNVRMGGKERCQSPDRRDPHKSFAMNLVQANITLEAENQRLLRIRSSH